MRTLLPYLQDRLGLRSDAQAAKVARFPLVAQLRALVESEAVEAKVEERLDFLEEELGLGEEMLRKVVVKNPALLGLSVEANLEPMVALLQGELGLSPVHLRKVVLKILQGYSDGVEVNLKPTLALLEEELELSREELRKIVVAFPHVLTCSEANLKATITFLEEELGFEQLREVVASHPQVLSCSVEANLTPAVAFLEEELELSPKELRKMVLSHPSVLGYSVEANLRPTIAFYANALSLDTRGVAEFVCSNPARLGRYIYPVNLTKTLEPRHARVLEAGIVVDSTVMTNVATMPEVKFGEWLEKKKRGLLQGPQGHQGYQGQRGHQGQRGQRGTSRRPTGQVQAPDRSKTREKERRPRKKHEGVSDGDLMAPR